jgi:hypothetical protein
LCRRHRALAAERDQVTSRIEVGRPEVDRPEATTA